MLQSPDSDPRLDHLLGRCDLERTPRLSPDRSHLKLHQSDECEPEVAPTPSAERPPNQQVEQLVEHLRGEHKKLAQREANLQAEVYHWEKQVMASKASLRKRAAELEQHLSQVRAQQTQLTQLQQSLVDGQTAIGKAVEQLVEQSDTEGLNRELQSLKRELDSRLEDFANRWERLAQSLPRD